MPLCTECNRIVKPVVAIDIDGTMGDYHSHFLRFAAAYLGIHITRSYAGEEPFREWFKAETGATDEEWHDIKLAYRQGGLKRSMPMYPGADALCSEIRHAGAELWVTTTRPYIRHDNIDPDTREWLRRHSIGYDYLIYDGAKYAKLAELVGPDRVCAVVDDLAEEITEAQRQFGGDVPILRMQHYNREITYDNESDDLSTITDLVLERIRRWHETGNARVGQQAQGDRRVRLAGGTGSATHDDAGDGGIH